MLSIVGTPYPNPTFLPAAQSLTACPIQPSQNPMVDFFLTKSTNSCGAPVLTEANSIERRELLPAGAELPSNPFLLLFRFGPCHAVDSTRTANMTKAAVDGAAAGDFDIKSVEEAITSSSTSLRTAQLRVIDEKISHNGDFSQPTLQ